MLADDQPPQSDRYAAEFARVAKRFAQKQAGKRLSAQISDELHDNLMAFVMEEVISVDSVVEDAIASYLGVATDADAELVDLLQQNETRKRETQQQCQGWTWVYQYAWFQVWRVREMVKLWKGNRVCDAFFEVKELRKQLREGDRNA